MEAIREQLKKPVVLGAICIIVGFFLGLVVFGWNLTPVEYYDAAPVDLHPTYREEYLRMAIEAFQTYPDAYQATQRWQALGDKAEDTLQAIQENPGTLNPVTIDAFSDFVQAPAAVLTPVSGETTPGGAEKKTSPLLTILLVAVGLTLLLAAVLGILYLLRQRGPATPKVKTPAMEAAEAARSATYTDYTTTEVGAPIAQFMASYKIGDDLFDDSFSIDSAAGEFLGECGVGISEPIGVGEPKKVTAFEVWIFDKNDIQTVTKVLMSAHAFNDNAIRSRLTTKGEPVQTEPSGQTVLETATLRLVARIVDMNYGEGPLPPQSYFDNLILELAIWQK